MAGKCVRWRAVPMEIHIKDCAFRDVTAKQYSATYVHVLDEAMAAAKRREATYAEFEIAFWEAEKRFFEWVEQQEAAEFIETVFENSWGESSLRFVYAITRYTR